MQVNIPSVVAEVEVCFKAYESALMQNEVELLIQCFWKDERAVRYGVAENLHGWDEIASFRKHRTHPPFRTLERTVITTFGEDFASVCTEFTRQGEHGRQSQTWVRTELGWRIVSAHISTL